MANLCNGGNKCKPMQAILQPVKKKQTPAQANRAKKVQKNLANEIKYLQENVTDLEDALYSRLPDLPEYPSLFEWHRNTIRSEAKQAKFFESKGGFLKWACSGAMEELKADQKRLESELQTKAN